MSPDTQRFSAEIMHALQQRGIRRGMVSTRLLLDDGINRMWLVDTGMVIASSTWMLSYQLEVDDATLAMPALRQRIVTHLVVPQIQAQLATYN